MTGIWPGSVVFSRPVHLPRRPAKRWPQFTPSSRRNSRLDELVQEALSANRNLAAADAHLITIKRGLEGVVVPSKMYGILAAGKPIVAVAPAECDVVSLGKQKGFSISAEPDDPAQFADCVRQLLTDGERVRKMGNAAAAAAPEYDRSRELQKLVAVVEESGLSRSSI